jgi:hypothetical protein
MYQVVYLISKKVSEIQQMLIFRLLRTQAFSKAYFKAKLDTSVFVTKSDAGTESHRRKESPHPLPPRKITALAIKIK